MITNVSLKERRIRILILHVCSLIVHQLCPYFPLNIAYYEPLGYQKEKVHSIAFETLTM